MIVKRLGRICISCDKRFEPDGKFQRCCNKCQEAKIRRFATIKVGMKINLYGGRK